MRNSDIFNEFVKIAQEKGLISSEPSTKKALAKTYDKEEVSTIEALYGVKPNSADKNDYSKNIMETAHPGNAVVSNSYDKINGLVENNNERQNILLHIVNKKTNGQLIQKKLARQNLLMSLIRVANDLDNKSEDTLRILADACIEKTANDGMRKNAILPALLPIAGFAVEILPIAIVVGGAWAIMHLNIIDHTFKENHDKLEDELKDFLNANTNYGVGHTYSQNLKNTVDDFIKKLDSFYKIYEKCIPIIQKIQKPSTKKELIELASKTDTGEIKNALEELKSGADDMVPYLEKVKNNFSSEDFKKNETETKGALTSFFDWTQILHGGNGLVPDDFDDVKLTIEAYQDSIKKIQKIMSESSAKKAQVETELHSAVSGDTTATTPAVKSEPSSTKTETKQDKPKPESKEEDGIDGGLEEIRNYFK